MYFCLPDRFYRTEQGTFFVKCLMLRDSKTFKVVCLVKLCNQATRALWERWPRTKSLVSLQRWKKTLTKTSINAEIRQSGLHCSVNRLKKRTYIWQSVWRLQMTKEKVLWSFCCWKLNIVSVAGGLEKESSIFQFYLILS